MFYSTEVLTSRKYGVATVWLVATLGSKSSLKRISRKAILDVDVSKACETIVEPDAPMALRLQSNLLYGVTRVYSQQCGYVLADAETARNSIRAIFKVMQQAALEPEGRTKGKSDQLMLQDDPNFLPGLDFMPLDLDNLNHVSSGALEETQETLSPHSSRTHSSQHSFGGLDLPASQSSLIGGPVGGLDLLSARDGSARGGKSGPAQLLDDDLGLTIDDDGNIHMDDHPVRQPRAPSDRVDPIGAVCSGGLSDQFGEPFLGPADDDGFMPIQNDFDVRMTDGSTGQQDRMQSDLQPQTTSETASAQAQRRQPRAKKAMPLDRVTSLRNSDLVAWQRNYLANMRDAMEHKQALRLATLAKKNAEHWVLGASIALGQGLSGPLNIFSGARIIEAFTGVDLLERGHKRQRDDPDSSDSGRRVRPRGEPSSDELTRGIDGDFFQQDDGFAPILNDDTLEQGREAPTPLDDRHVSSIFPWNQSAGSRPPTDAGHPSSTSFGGGMHFNTLGRRGSRLTSASPLVGRDPFAGQAGDLENFDSDMAMGALTGEEDFELYGLAAQVDTETAAQSQWQRAALGAESANFLDFVRTAIDESDDSPPPGQDSQQRAASIDFQDLLPPESNSNVVAAQALLHVLTLGTKNLLKIQQAGAFGPIILSH
ncbi:unnamed protein product [Lecanosticta acicola]|uniref:Unnamed protein product n=1 Tax=Lecanosticta acicola TaxID=111012 RepID=A0AAI8Z9L4_9PEZI|nr:unnamed protein product [Lecanosticta acicola]